MTKTVDLTEIKRLMAEAERAGPNDFTPRLKFNGAALRTAPAMIEELERLRSENEALRKDAERFVWLIRSDEQGTAVIDKWFGEHAVNTKGMSLDEVHKAVNKIIREAIDIAIAEEKK